MPCTMIPVCPAQEGLGGDVIPPLYARHDDGDDSDVHVVNLVVVSDDARGPHGWPRRKRDRTVLYQYLVS